MSAPLSPERLAEYRVLAPYAGDRPYVASQAIHALLAEVERLRARVDEMVRTAMGDRAVRLFDDVGEVQNARTVADAQLARADTLERLARESRAAAGLASEYRVPTTAGRWLSVRREPRGDRWAIFSSVRSANGYRRAWAAGRWQTLPAYGENGVWEYASADAALAEATRLTEVGEPR